MCTVFVNLTPLSFGRSYGWLILTFLSNSLSFFFFLKILPCFSTSGKIPPAYLSPSLSLLLPVYFVRSPDKRHWRIRGAKKRQKRQNNFCCRKEFSSLWPTLLTLSHILHRAVRRVNSFFVLESRHAAGHRMIFAIKMFIIVPTLAKFGYFEKPSPSHRAFAQKCSHIFFWFAHQNSPPHTMPYNLSSSFLFVFFK